MSASREQIICMICFELRITASETYDMLQTAFGEDALLKAQMNR
jgi:hypothetical protein